MIITLPLNKIKDIIYFPYFFSKSSLLLLLKINR